MSLSSLLLAWRIRSLEKTVFNSMKYLEKVKSFLKRDKKELKSLKLEYVRLITQ